jgi:hypothetical protein
VPVVRLADAPGWLLRPPERGGLAPADVAALAEWLVALGDAGAGCVAGARARDEAPEPATGGRPHSPYPAALERGQGIVEAALVIPVLLLLVVGVAAAGRLTLAQSGVSAVAREAARAGAGASSGPEAAARGLERGLAVAEGYGLARPALELEVDGGAFGRGGWVRATARYAVRLSDLPLLGWATVRLESTDRERVERHRSLWS